jgi:hypothetical protein
MTESMRRALLGLLALVLLATGLIAWGGANETISGTSLRLGIVLALVWLAWPQLRRLPVWIVAVVGVALVLAMRWPKLLWGLLPLAVLLWLLRPRGSQSGTFDRTE